MLTDHLSKLKEATQASHKKIEELPFFTALSNDSLPAICLIGQLRSFATHCGVLEAAIGDSNHEGVRQLWTKRTPKLPFILEDLDKHALQLPDIRPAVELSLSSVAKIRKDSLDTPASLIGYLYVIEGTTLGNAVHAADAAKVLRLAEGDVLKAYNVYGDRLAENWRDFSAQLNAIDLSPSEQQQMIDASVELFDWLFKIHEALLPYDEKDLFYSSTTINPEAGHHPVPQDPVEINAAIRAGQRCCEMFPYFERRYEQRGHRYADSDTCWLATLYDLDEHAAEGQVRWLAGVLAARGMPSLTLIRQLELLHEELCSARPEKSDRYEKLGVIARTLLDELSQIVTEEEMNHMVASFENEMPENERAKNPDAGLLLVNAFMDEALGRKNAVESLLGWLCDTGTHSSKWVAGVEAFAQKLKETITKA